MPSRQPLYHLPSDFEAHTKQGHRRPFTRGPLTQSRPFLRKCSRGTGAWARKPERLGLSHASAASYSHLLPQGLGS